MSTRTFCVTLAREWRGRWTSTFTADIPAAAPLVTDLTIGRWEVAAANGAEARSLVAEHLLRASLCLGGMTVEQVYVKQLTAT